MMLGLAAQVLSGPNVHLIHSSYAELPEVLPTLNISAVDRILLDLGLSSDQLADRERGFGFQTAGPLDMRFDTSTGQPVWELLESANEEQLANIFHEYGEERFSRQIAAAIVDRRRSRPVRTAADLVAAVEETVPAKSRRESHSHPATRAFQALRIAVNEELNHLQRALDRSLDESLAPGGRLVVITFHSLEDRMVKDAFRNKERWQNLTSKPVPATPLEQKVNPRSRTAKLRAARRI
jgi:16S rRNA (cytosine1402-N4)-methyltransferase